MKTIESCLHSPVDPKKLEKCGHHMRVDDEGRIWLASVQGHLYFIEGDGDEMTRIDAPEIGHLSPRFVRILMAPMTRGVLVQSHAHGVLRVTPDGVSVLEGYGGEANEVCALATNVDDDEFVLMNASGEIVRHRFDGERLDVWNARELMGLDFSISSRTTLAINDRWLIMANLETIAVLDRQTPGAKAYKLSIAWYDQLHLSGDTLMCHDSSTYFELDLLTREYTKHSLTGVFDQPVDVRAMDFESRVVAAEGKRDDKFCGFAMFDQDGFYGLHPLQEALERKRTGRISAIHEDLKGRLWIQGGSMGHTRYLVFDTKGKPAKFKKA